MLAKMRATSLGGLAALAAAALAPAIAADDSGDAMMAGRTGPARVVHDAAYFKDRVLPILDRHCVECHDTADKKNETKNRLVPKGRDGAWTDDEVRANYENVVKFLDPARPERSTVLLKLTPLSAGGIDHDGGKADDEHFPRDLIDPKGPLVAWIFGATAAAAPPVAVAAPVPRTVELGGEVPLDASLSFDPDGDPVTVSWEVADAPQNAKAKIDDPSAKKTRIVPDREGPWVLRVRPSDGKLGGLPARLRFAVVAKRTEGSPPPTAVPATDIDPAARRVTRELFIDLLGRTPTDEELGRWAPLADEERVDRLLSSVDVWRNWFDDEAFYFLLIDQFRPVSDRLAAVPEGMAKGETTFRDAHREFALSAEFNARNPGNDTYVTVVLEQFLGIEVQKEPRVLAAGKKMYDGAVARLFDQKGENQSDVVRITLAQPAYADLFLRRMETRYFGAELPKADHDAALSLVSSDASLFKQVLREWLLSDRYCGATRAPKAKSDMQFIRSLFVDLLGRAPAYEEFRNMRNALLAVADPKPLRGVLAKVLLDSGAAIAPSAAAAAAAPGSTGVTADQADSQVRELFRRLLGRDPTRPEHAAFTAALREPGTTWRTAALALLTSPHYQYY
jgi:hypothetical protein